MKKKVLPIIIVAALIILIIGITFIMKLIDKYTPTKETMALTEQYAVTDSSQVAIILNQELIETQAVLINDEVYLTYSFVHDQLNSRFYWDNNENILLYTTANDLISVNAESNSYLVSKSSNDFGKTIVKVDTANAYINIDFIKQYTDISYEYYNDNSCPRLLLYTPDFYGSKDIAEIKKDSQIRVLGGIKSPILTEITKSDKVYVLTDLDDWKEVMTTSGIIGYIPSKVLVNASTTEIGNEFTPESFSHIEKDFKISMLWHQVTSTSANSNVSAVLSESKGVNVISPTWFYLNDNEGNLYDLASNTYVNYCHQQGVEVWALFSNIENADVDTSYVLTHTSTRQNLVNQIISMAISYNLDGVNLDFEAMSKEEVGDAYIQFIRELSLKCANNDIVLSVDNYAPTEYTSFYNRSEQALFADYLILMGYDEHYKGSEAGSIASKNWVEEGVTNTLKEVPGKQLILGMPFFNRIWTVTPTSAAEDGAYVEYETSCYSVGMDEGASLLKRNGAELVWLDDCGQYYGEYTTGDSTVKIWLEDVNALQTKLDIMANHDLSGAAYWKAGLESQEVWDTIIKYMN